jgi:hypothetical protein
MRDPGHNERLGKALMRQPWPRFTRLRRDAHEETASCWFHGETFCFDSA